MKDVTLKNPSAKIQKYLMRWLVRFEWVTTCHSDTCGHMSHDSGYKIYEYAIPEAVWNYVEGRIKRESGDVSSHGSCYWPTGKAERELRDRSKTVAERMLSLLNEVAELRRAGMKLEKNFIHDVVLEKPASLDRLNQLGWELAGEKQERRAKARRNQRPYPVSGNGWRLIPG